MELPIRNRCPIPPFWLPPTGHQMAGYRPQQLCPSGDHRTLSIGCVCHRHGPRPQSDFPPQNAVFRKRRGFSPDRKWIAFLSDESGEAKIYMQALEHGEDSLRVTGERFLNIPGRSAMPALAQRRKGTLLPGTERRGLRCATRFAPFLSPCGETGGSFHNRSRSPLEPSIHFDGKLVTRPHVASITDAPSRSHAFRHVQGLAFMSSL